MVLNKILPILIILLGEVISISAEVIAAKHFYIEGQPFNRVFLRLLPFMIISVLLLLSGYMLGLQAFKNIWVVSAISITSILIAEPIINYAITSQLPTTGAIIGLILGVMGFIATFVL